MLFQKNKKGTQPMPKGKSCVPYFVTIFMLEKHQKPLSIVTISPAVSYTHLDVYKRQVQSSLVGSGNVVVNADWEGNAQCAQLLHCLLFVLLTCFLVQSCQMCIRDRESCRFLPASFLRCRGSSGIANRLPVSFPMLPAAGGWFLHARFRQINPPALHPH